MAAEVLRDLLNCLKSEPICFPVRWHICITIAIVTIFEQSLINPGNDRNFMGSITVGLRYNVVADDLQESCLFNRKEANRRNIIKAFQYYFTGLRIPELLLRQYTEIRIITWLPQGTNNFLGPRIPWTFIIMPVSIHRYFSLLIRLANKPMNPAAANN